MTYNELIASLEFDDSGAMTANVTEDWMQGRTTYGGLTSALCLKAATAIAGGRPIRSAQIAFVGPVAGPVVCTPTLLREGKNTAFVSVRMTGETGIAAEAIFTFGKSRASTLDYQNLPAPTVTSPEKTESYFGNSPMRPTFTNNFNMRMAAGDRPVSGAAAGDITLWMRHKDNSAIIEPATVLSIADAPPPAAMSMLSVPAPISSMTWMAEFLTEDFSTDEGWYLARHTAETAAGGYSSQRMVLWNRQGRPVMIGRQTIAVFG